MKGRAQSSMPLGLSEGASALFRYAPGGHPPGDFILFFHLECFWIILLTAP
jgi:hypothetical protein